MFLRRFKLDVSFSIVCTLFLSNKGQQVQKAGDRVTACWQPPPEGGHAIIPGQWVMIRSFKSKPLEPKWQGPYQVLLVTDAAVLCQGKKTWIHVSHCKVIPPPTGTD